MSQKGLRHCDIRSSEFGVRCFASRKFHQMLLSFLLLCLLYGCAIFPQADSGQQMLTAAGTETEGQSAWLFSPIQFFQEYISPVDGDRCPMYPSCSHYSLEAIRKHGFLKGWIMTCDRLVRCGRDELKRAPRVIIRGEACCHDPVSENDFWFDNS